MMDIAAYKDVIGWLFGPGAAVAFYRWSKAQGAKEADQTHKDKLYTEVLVTLAAKDAEIAEKDKKIAQLESWLDSLTHPQEKP